MTIWTVSKDSDGYRLNAVAHSIPCLVGKAGLIAESDKREGDMATPVGDWPLRRVYYRPDRVALPATSLPSIALTPAMGWCDDPGDANYNMPVELPFNASHERLWREDGLYDFIVVLGHNDSPPRPFLGSAVFLHLYEQDTPHTAGCVAIAKDDMVALLRAADTKTILRVGNDGPEETTP
ncbi:MAG: L,D-transpeptidase family protein [Pseudomonadota bacterium]|nr:L,D-transpeptidase family protein [Pseudomonadota bacterium]